MGYGGTIRCLDCGHSFEAMLGGGFDSSIMRCISCNEEETITYDESNRRDNDYLFQCKLCGGALRIDVLPWCPICKSKNTVFTVCNSMWD